MHYNVFPINETPPECGTSHSMHVDRFLHIFAFFNVIPQTGMNEQIYQIRKKKTTQMIYSNKAASESPLEFLLVSNEKLQQTLVWFF